MLFFCVERERDLRSTPRGSFGDNLRILGLYNIISFIVTPALLELGMSALSMFYIFYSYTRFLQCSSNNKYCLMYALYMIFMAMSGNATQFRQECKSGTQWTCCWRACISYDNNVCSLSTSCCNDLCAYEEVCHTTNNRCLEAPVDIAALQVYPSTDFFFVSPLCFSENYRACRIPVVSFSLLPNITCC